MANENYEGFDLTIYNLFTLLREMYYSRGETETNFLSKSGGTLGGSLTIQGNLTVQGNSYKIDTEDLVVKDYTITLAKDNEQALLSMVGMVVPKYDGTNYGFFGWDADGYAYVGDLDNWDGSSAITLANNSSLQKIATIKDTATGTTSDDIMVYDQTNKVFKKAPSGRYVIEDNELVASNDNNALYNVGAFDTISGNTITRQTGYVDLSKLSWSVYSEDNVTRIATIDLNIYSPFAYVTSNNYTCGYVGNDKKLYVNVGTSDASVNPTGILQYKLSTSYTESIIENQSLLNLDSNGCNFLRNEWEKGLNLLPNYAWLNHYKIDESTGQMSGGAWYQEYNSLNEYVELKPNTTYSLTASGGIGSRLYIFYYDSSKNFLSYAYADKGGMAYYSFTTISTFAYVRFMTYGSGNQSALSQVMLNYGTHPYPYQEYNGAIVREKDIEPVLLWENSSPTSDFADNTSSPISIANLSNYKYLVIGIQQTTTSSGIIYTKIKNMVANSIPLNTTWWINSTLYTLMRNISIASGSISFSDGYAHHNTSNDVANNCCIPVAIYGTNVL